jgi:hypothetical protein
MSHVPHRAGHGKNGENHRDKENETYRQSRRVYRPRGAVASGGVFFARFIAYNFNNARSLFS